MLNGNFANTSLSKLFIPMNKTDNCYCGYFNLDNIIQL